VWILEHVALLKNWLYSVETEAFQRLMRGKKVPGFKLVQGRTFRAWKDKKKATKLLLSLGLKPDEVEPRDILSPAQAERLIRSRNLKSKWGKIEKLITRPTGKVSIAPLHDPRTAIVRGSEFEGVTINTED
jgi:Protein of unknown function (DUF2800)